MADYIDREKFLEDLERFAPECRAAFLIIRKQNAVDAVPVVHGRWIVKEHSAPYGGYHLFHCSECDEPNAREKNYCPNCGAKMDLEENDGE